MEPVAKRSRTEQSELKLILVGCGRMGKFHASNLRAIPDCNLLCVVDVVEKAAEALGKEFDVPARCDFEASLKEFPSCTAVVIATPAGLHQVSLLPAAAAGKHIFVEKPFTLTLEDAMVCAKAIERAGVICQVGFMRRFDVESMKVRQLAHSQAVGKVQMIRVRSFDGIKPGVDVPLDYYRTCGGVFFDMVCHDLDMIRHLAGEEAASVSVVGSVTVDPIFSELKSADTVVTTIKFQSGALGWIENLRFASYGHDTQIEVIGTEGSVSCGPMDSTAVRVSTKHGVNHGRRMDHYERYLPTFKDEMLEFVRACQAGKPSAVACDFKGGLANLHLIQACEQSFASGRCEEVKQLD